MNSNDYIHFMTQKSRLAIAIAVLNSKPTELTVNQYIEQLKEKLNETIDIDVISVNSNDFNFDEHVFNESFNSVNDITSNENNESATIVQDFNKTNDCLRSCDVNRREMNVFEILRDLNANENQKEPNQNLLSTNCTQSIYDEDSTYNTPNDNKPANNSTKTNEIHKEIPHRSISNTTVQDNVDTNNSKHIELANKIAKNINKQIQSIMNNTKDDKDGGNIDNNAKTTTTPTVINNIDNYMNIATNVEKDTQEVYNEYFGNGFTMEVTEDFHANVVDEKIIANVRKNVSKMSKKEHFENVSQHSYNGKEKDVDVVKNFNKNVLQEDLQLNIENIRNTNFCENNTIDTQETVIYTLYDITDNNTHITQSQFENIEVRECVLYGNNNYFKNNFQEVETVMNSENFESNIQERKKKQNENIKDIENNTLNDNMQVQNENKLEIKQIQTTEIEYVIDRNGKTFKIIQNYPTSKTYPQENSNIWNPRQNSQDTSTNNMILMQDNEEQNKNGNNTLFTNNVANIQTEDQYIDIQGGNTNNTTDINGSNNNEEIYKESESELIPFKVIKELNKVKQYLNKRYDGKEDADLTDSGYRSDTQSKSSNKSDQLSDHWLNQSAHCLYVHLSQCPLVSATVDITKEISQVIGKLIDRLHEEEKYPTFLEQLLKNVDKLLEDIFNGNGNCENDLLNKEEIFQRLCLLNKSIHILKYTIDKITQILDKVRTDLINNDDLYEIKNIEEVENLSHIFHLIEILIPKYMNLKLNENISQTQSQENKLLKKSSITEIWRKKWDPNFKEVTNFEGRCEKKCILPRLAEVLNKIVVDCIEGYSLISFAALQCFNLMQK